MKRVDRYPRTVFWSDEDGGYIAIVPDLPGCSAFGETREEALVEIEVAAEGWIEVANELGNPIPEPTIPRPEPQASGKVLLRLPRTLHQRLIDEAKRERTSLNQYLVYLLGSGGAAAKHQKVEIGGLDFDNFSPKAIPVRMFTNEYMRALISKVKQRPDSATDTSEEKVIFINTGSSPWQREV